MKTNIWLAVAVMALVTYCIRVLPLTLIRREIKNRFIRSFLFYVPYVTLAVMTFPAILECTRVPLAGVLALAAGVVLAWLGAGLFPVAIVCCAAVFLTELALLPPV